MPTPDQTDHSTARQRQCGCAVCQCSVKRVSHSLCETVVGFARQPRPRDDGGEGDKETQAVGVDRREQVLCAPESWALTSRRTPPS